MKNSTNKVLRIGTLTENSGCEENASKYSRSIRIRAETRSTAQGSIPFPRSISSFDYLPVEKRSYGVRPTNAAEEKNISSVSVQFEKHQPERRRGGEGYLLCGGGCCCCSCCLHSLGGLIGAAAATSTRKSPTGGSVIGCYWTVLTLLTVAICVWASASAAGLGLIAALFFLPLVQLAASLVTFIWVQVRPEDFADKKTSLRTLGRITLWSFLGTLAGGGAMIIGFKMFS